MTGPSYICLIESMLKNTNKCSGFVMVRLSAGRRLLLHETGVNGYKYQAYYYARQALCFLYSSGVQNTITCSFQLYASPLLLYP
jgi:hypothetical protein